MIFQKTKAQPVVSFFISLLKVKSHIFGMLYLFPTDIFKTSYEVKMSKQSLYITKFFNIFLIRVP